MKNANIGTRVNPTFDGFRRRRVAIAETHIYNRGPRRRFVWEGRMRFFRRKDLARELQITAPALTNPWGLWLGPGQARRSFPLSLPPLRTSFRRQPGVLRRKRRRPNRPGVRREVP